MKLDYNSLRARKARFSRLLHPAFSRALLLSFGFTIIGFGLIFLLILKNSIGWLYLGFAFPLLMLYYWNKNELDPLPIKSPENFTNITSRDCLCRLKKNPTPLDIMNAAMSTRSGIFLMNRFLIGTNFLTSVAKDLDLSSNQIFQSAMKIRNETNSEQITGAVLVVAILEGHPECEQILKTLKLETKDLRQGVIWFNYLYGLVKDAQKPRHTGGIGRDLAFGYTPLLAQFALNISQKRERVSRTQIHQGDRKEILDKMVSLLSKNGRRNVALVGPYGSGRSTIVEAFAETLLDADSKLPASLKFSQIFILDASALISAATGPGKLERLVSELVHETQVARNAILCFDDAHLFFENGNGSVDISNILLPILTSSNVRMIFEMDEQKFLEISSRNSALANAFNKVVVSGTNQEETMKILQDLTPSMEFDNGVIYTYYSLTEAYRLSDRYMKDVEMPGKAKLLLQSAATFAEGKLVTDKSVQEAIEKTVGVKIQTEKTAEEKAVLLNLEDRIHERMIDQEGAVHAVSDALRRAAAGVRNEKRPIGTFLFLGPTGVGKTELAKALSETYFNGESEIIRLDLNEFASASDISRLIADASDNEKSLTAQVMKRPFSVVLLDEIEKAHPKILTTLLQVLDEGILRDINNREVSFRDTIIVATSNAGADLIRATIDAKKDLLAAKEAILDHLISSGEFRPEFLNRFDEICLFKPLTKNDLEKILRLIIASVNKTLDPQKVHVELDASATKLLIERGYDPKMGARPMRRIVQKTIENIVAKSVLSGEATAGSVLHLSANDIESELSS
ncbi:ATP-dependent Clp protease ATP-binding subunit [Candidatus Saccharibacteria bacterium]|nr:ATP-dependent Clp protease ATP-binding subunit [Candidatus Saccharibacteria bacterium]